jgi:hypothetical protein
MEMLTHVLRNPEVRDEIGVSAEVFKAIQEGTFELRKQQVDLRADLQKAAMEQARLMMAEETERDELMAAVEKTGAIRTKLAKLRMEQLLLVRSKLSSEQLDKLRGLVAQRHRRRAPMREKIERRRRDRGAAERSDRRPFEGGDEE